MHCRPFFLFAFFLIVDLVGFADVVQGQQKDSLTRVDILYAERLGGKKVDSVNTITTLAGKVKLKQGNTIFYGDSAVIQPHLNLVEAFGNIHIVDNDSLHTYAQYLKYLSLEQKAFLQKKVKLTDGKGTLTTDDLTYDTKNNIGTFENGGRVVNKQTVLTSQRGIYYADVKDVHFLINVKLKDPQFQLKTDSLLYNTATETARFIAPTYIEDSSKRNIYTTSGYYDLKNKQAQFGDRPIVRDKGVFLTGENIAFDDKLGVAQAKGNAILRDTANGVTVVANQLLSNQKKNSFLATEKPLMILKQKSDSIFIAADSLIAGRLTDLLLEKELFKANLRDTMPVKFVQPEKDSTNRFFQAFRNVRIFSDSLQAKADSLFFSGVDSIFRFYTNPIVWSNGNQVTGDTLYLFTKQKQPEYLKVYENAFTISKAGGDYFDQVSSTQLEAWFTNGNLDSIRAKGTAETIYYPKDEDGAFTACNKATCDWIDIYFDQVRQLKKVVLRSNVKGTTYPIRKVNAKEMLLPNFNWREKERPTSPFELME